jgi:SAM-dependent methyltransferase
VLRRLYDATWGRLFARIYDRVLAASEREGLRDLRRETLAAASGRTLEVGAGTGLNRDLYPDAVGELVVTEPFGPMAAQLRERWRDAERQVEVIEAPAEALPFPDDSFDTVVVTLVLCTVADLDAALREIARVLAPGGRLLFLEHVRARDPKLARWQDRLHGPWYALGHGCNCNRDTLTALERSALTVESVEEGELPKSPPITRPLIRGAAVAAALAALMLVGTASAGAATLATDRSCYGPGDKVGLTGAGFTPDGDVALSVEGRQLGVGRTDAAGGFGLGLTAPQITGKQRTDIFTATDQADLGITADAPVRLTALEVKMTPRNSRPGRKRRIRARGFTHGRALWAHIRRGKYRRNIRVGRLKGPCGRLDVRRKILPRNAKVGVYRVQFDAQRRYSRRTKPSVQYLITVFRKLRLG